MDDLILAIDLGKFNSVCCWYDTENKSATFRHAKTTRAVIRRERYEKNCPAAEVVRRALNRPDDARTDQQNLSPSAVRLLTAEAISAFGLRLAAHVRRHLR